MPPARTGSAQSASSREVPRQRFDIQRTKESEKLALQRHGAKPSRLGAQSERVAPQFSLEHLLQRATAIVEALLGGLRTFCRYSAVLRDGPDDF
jgi:hypothetical protein